MHEDDLPGDFWGVHPVHYDALLFLILPMTLGRPWPERAVAIAKSSF
jgi:hypothetical protein